MKKNKELLNFILIFFSGALFGTQGFFVKTLTGYGSSPAYSTFLRMSFTFITMLVIVIAIEGPKALKITRQSLISCALLGVVCHAMNNACYSASINLIGMSIAVSLLYTAPVFTSVFARILFKEKYNSRKVLSLILNITGCILTVTGGNFTGVTFNIRGILLGFGSGICFSLLPIFGRFATVSDDDSPLAITMYNFLFASMFLAASMRAWRTVENPTEPRILLFGFLLGLFCTVIPYIMYFIAIKGISETTKIPIIQSDEVIVAVIVGLVIFKEPMNMINMIGVAIVLVSIVLINTKKQADL